MTSTSRLAVGLATYRAIAALYAEAAEWAVTATHAYDAALHRAQAAFLRSATVTKWKAYLVAPTDDAARALLAEDLWNWGALSGLAPEFEGDTPNWLVRQALMNAATKLGWKEQA